LLETGLLQINRSLEKSGRL
jgi:hypothetical protein